MDIKEMFIENPIIAAIRNDYDLKIALESTASFVFVLYGTVMNIGHICEELKKNGKIVFVHVDLIEGLKGDHSGLEFIKKYADPFGIITTKSTNVKHGRNLELYVIQRLFIVDSLSFKTGIKNIEEAKPNAIEVMPGIAGKIIEKMQQRINQPIIAGGLINTKDDVIEALKSGALAISTTTHNLWNL